MARTTPLSADEYLAAMRAEGLDVAGYGNWRTHGRQEATGKTFGPVNGLVIHHTAGRNSLALCYNGTSSLPGPLCHNHLAKNGRHSILSVERANHAGTFARNAHNAVLAETSPHPRPDAAEPIDGNDHYYGLEIENLGDGDDVYPWKQYVAAVKWATAICRKMGWKADSVIGHKEGTRRKIDPKGPVVGPNGTVFQFDMDTFRAHVRMALALPAGAWATDREEEEIMAISDADAQKIATAVIYRTIVNPARLDSEGNPKRTPVYAFLRSEDAHYDKTTERLNRLTEKVDAVAEAVGRVSVGGVDLDALAAKVADELQRRLQS